MTPVRQLWLDIALVAVALAPLAWMGRQWLKEWRAYKTGTMIPRGYRPPEPPTLRQPWRWRFLWLYAAQAAAIGGLMSLTLIGPWLAGEKAPPEAFLVSFVCWTAVVALTTAVLTRLWDRTASFRRSRGAAGQSQQPSSEQVGVLRPGRGLHQRP